MPGLQEILDSIARDVAPHVGEGKVASYIPELAKVDPKQFGISAATVDGQVYSAGDAGEAFSIQSISKVFSLTLALGIAGDSLWTKVGREPSGSAFNSIVQLESEKGRPRNPFINAGAIAVADIILGGHRPKEAIGEIVQFVRYLADDDPTSPLIAMWRNPRLRPGSAMWRWQISCAHSALSIIRRSWCSASIFTNARWP